MRLLPSSARMGALIAVLASVVARPVVAQPPSSPSAAAPQDPRAEAEEPPNEPDGGASEQSPPQAARTAYDGETSITVTPEDADGGSSRATPNAPAVPSPPKLRRGADPIFPDAARQAGLKEGHVTLKVRIGVDGKVEETTVVEGAGLGFDEAAREAAARHSFEPATLDGVPVAALVLLRIDFHALPEQTPPVPVESTAGTPRPTDAKLSSTAVTPATAAPSRETSIEVTVAGQSVADRLRRSAEAVNVVELHEAKRHTQDLGEVLARTQGVAVQRSSGLGSDTRIFLNGLTDDQIRFFVDGIPLDFTGYPFGIANVPVNLINRIEVYRGVVPVRFGADALGGAINLVSDEGMDAGAHGAASIQAGSFGTYRATASSHYRDETNGWLARVAAFLDLAKNDYPMNVVVPDASGQEVEARVYRFHDGYRALGANVEAGVFDKTWARRFSVKGFVSDYSKDVQHNLLMSFNPYGDVEYGQFAGGGTVNYEQVIAKRVATKVVAGYAYRHLDYTDVGECVYNWFGQCFRERAQPGERIGRAQDQDYWEHNAFARMNVDWRPHSAHALHLSLSPNYATRSGKEHRMANPDARDPLSAERKISGLVTGLEYQLDLLEGDLENRLFVKDYLQLLRSEDPLSNGVDFRREDRTTHRIGFGDGLRYSVLEWLYLKGSYEWATRLPRPDEIFGNAFPVQPNLGLRPEVSHNFNLGFTVDARNTAAGDWRAEVNGFVRDVHELIRLVGDEESASYKNVRDARSVGAESALGWTSVGQYLALDANATYVDFRNTSQDGADADYEGDRIPNRPYLFATGNARLQLSQLAAAGDDLSLSWTSRYVHSFFRGWESIGTDKPVVPKQLLHSLALTYALPGDPLDLSFSSELQNITDTEAYDYFGVPKPGRAFYFKMTSSL